MPVYRASTPVELLTLCCLFWQTVNCVLSPVACDLRCKGFPVCDNWQPVLFAEVVNAAFCVANTEVQKGRHKSDGAAVFEVFCKQVALRFAFFAVVSHC